MEKLTRVKARVVAHAIREIMEGADEVYVMGHHNEDFDCFGAAMGVAKMARVLEKPVHIVLSEMNEGIDKFTDLLQGKEEYEVTVLEESTDLGGICKTVNYKGNRMDMGGHRFFSKVPEVNEWWEKMMPMQGSPSYDDILLGRTPELAPGGPDPERRTGHLL